jgi:predicted nucleotidyltransferase
MDYGLTETTINKLVSVFSACPQIEQVILYGSRAKGNFRNGSDIDLTIVGKSVTHSLQLRLENTLDDLLLPYKIDLSLLHEIENLDLLDHIKRVGVILYRRTAEG